MVEILLVEDDEGDIFMLREILVNASFDANLHIAHDGEEALEFLRNQAMPKIDFIISDINMPRMNGHEFLEEIGKDALFKKIPVAVLTNSHEAEDFVKTWDLNAAICLSKPLTQGKITEIVQSVEFFWRQNSVA